MAKRQENAKKNQESWDINEIKSLISIINRNKIREFELEQGDMKIHVLTQYHEPAKQQQSPPPQPAPQFVSLAPPIQGMAQGVAPMQATPSPAQSSQAQPQTPESKPEPEEKKEEKKKEVEEDENLTEIKSPMVGTFYRAPSPDSPPYVEVGDMVKSDTVLCIVEAMKLMNEIKAECSGKVMEILVENGQPVEYGQPMFKIK